MDFPTFINKFVIGFIPIKYTVFWYWFRLINHDNWRMDDHQRYWDFWINVNAGWLDMNYQWEFEKFWGKGAKPEKIVLPAKDFDALVERLNEPPDPAVVERIREIMNRKAPWDDNSEH
jgi:hypothetical protein